jgi:autotransporter-associated beta strand protein
MWFALFRSHIFGRNIYFLALLISAISLLGVSHTIAGFYSGMGAETITHDGGFGGTPDSFYNEVDFSAPWWPPVVGPCDMPELAFAPIQVANTITSGNNVSYGRAGISQWHTSNWAYFFVAPSWRIYQYAPEGGNSAASIKIDFWTDFDPGRDKMDLFGFYNFPLSGYVSPGGYVEFLMNVTMYGRTETSGAWVDCFRYPFQVDWLNATPGYFNQLFSDYAALGTLLGSTSENDLEMYGTIEFRAKNDSGPTSIVAPEGLGFGSGMSVGSSSNVSDTRWTGANSNIWLDAGNWTSAAPAAGAIIEFDAAAPANQPLLQNIAAPLSLKTILFAPNAVTHYLGGQTIQFTAWHSIECASAADQFINNPLELATFTTCTVSGSGKLILGGEISGSGGLLKNGSGTLVLSNNATYASDTVIEEGILALDTAGQIVNSSINNNATFQILSGDHTVGAITGDGATEIDSGSLTANSIYQDSLTMGAGATLTIAPIPGGYLSGNLTPVPEPAAIGFLAVGIMSALAFKMFRRK